MFLLRYGPKQPDDNVSEETRQEQKDVLNESSQHSMHKKEYFDFDELARRIEKELHEIELQKLANNVSKETQREPERILDKAVPYYTHKEDTMSLGDELKRKVQPYKTQKQEKEEANRRAVERHVDYCMKHISEFFKSADPRELYKGKVSVTVTYTAKSPLKLEFYEGTAEVPVYDSSLLFKRLLWYETKRTIVYSLTYDEVPDTELFFSALSGAVRKEGLRIHAVEVYDKDIATIRYNP